MRSPAVPSQELADFRVAPFLRPGSRSCPRFGIRFDRVGVLFEHEPCDFRAAPAIDVGLEPGLAFESVAAGNNQLRVMQGESSGITTSVVRLHFG